MSRAERLALKGRVAELKAHIRQLRVEMEGLRFLVRQSLPSYGDVIDVDAEQAVSSATILASKQTLLRTLTAELEQLQEELD